MIIGQQAVYGNAAPISVLLQEDDELEQALSLAEEWTNRYDSDARRAIDQVPVVLSEYPYLLQIHIHIAIPS